MGGAFTDRSMPSYFRNYVYISKTKSYMLNKGLGRDQNCNSFHGP